MADIEGKHLGDTDIYKDKGKSYLRVSLSVGYSGKEVSNIKKIEKIVGMKAKAGSPEICDDLDESVNEEQLDEKLITFSNRAAYGQIVFMAGGAGSGKGFAIDNFIDGAGFKVRDVDEMKKQLVS